MSNVKKDLEQKVIVNTIELIESISNNKVNSITLDNGEVFYRAETHVLKLIYDEPGIFSSEIARRFSVTRAAIQKTLGRLEERKLITKEIDQMDKKRIRLFLTSTGRESIELLIQYQMKINSVFFLEISNLSKDDLMVVNRFLTMSKKVVEEMQKIK